MNDAMTAALTERLRTEAGGDPLTAMLIEQMSAAAAASSAPDETERLKARLGRAQDALDRARADVVSANTMAEWVADVLGACPACWGLDRACRRCGGAGVPGSRAPDVEQLVAWVEPALRSAGLAICNARADHPATTPEREEVTHGSARE